MYLLHSGSSCLEWTDFALATVTTRPDEAGGPPLQVLRQAGQPPKRRGRHAAIIDPETFAQVQQVLDAHRASGDRSHKHSHYLVGSQLRCKLCSTRLGYSRNKGNGGVYEYFTCLSRVSMQGSCGALYFRAYLVERAIERKYKTYLITPEQQAVIREVLHAHAETSRKVARDDAARHERRVRELISQQQKLLDLYYDDGVSKEVLQAEQKRIETEQRVIEKLAAAARYEVAELDQALDDALLLIDTRVAPYLSGNPTERRLINLAIYTTLLVSGTDTVQAEATPLYAQMVPLAPEASRARRPKNDHSPVFRGYGAKSLQMAGSSGQFANHAALDRLMAALMEPVSRGIRARAAEAVEQRSGTNPGSVYYHLNDAT
jgi:hypothetical protein